MIRHLAAIVLLLIPQIAYAGAFAEVSSGAVRITLYREACTLPAIANLPKRAQWFESGKSFEGCWGINPMGIITIYWADRTAVSIPSQAFVALIDA